MREGKGLLICVICFILAGWATGNPTNRAMAGEDAGSKLRAAVETYRRIEPRLTDEQRQQFSEAFYAISKAYQTAGVLLASVMEATDPASANTALASYERIVSVLPNMINELEKVVKQMSAQRK